MDKMYDFVIVGGGTAGLVVANRLTKDPNVEVAVFEAGGDMMSDPRVKIPALFNQLKNTDADWAFQSEAQPGLKGRCIDLTQGRLLGGSSALNAQVFVPPSARLIDAWEGLGNPGWNWNMMKSYYAKAYSLKAPNPELVEHLGLEWIDKDYVATQGPVQTSYAGHGSGPVPRAWFDTFKAMGHDMKGNPFAGKASGAFSCLASVDPVTRERSFAGPAYYLPVRDRKNLHVLTGVTIERILLKKQAGVHRATGIEWKSADGQTMAAKARKEVILAAGALQSPKLLELSGIGKAELLARNGIEVQIENFSVGENLQDHVVAALEFEAKDHVPTLDDLVRQDPKAIEAAMAEYMGSKTGPLSSVGVSGYAYLPVMDFVSEAGQKMLISLLARHAPKASDDPTSSESLSYQSTSSILKDKDIGSGAFLALPSQAPFSPHPETGEALSPAAGKWITLVAILSHPISRGTVHIRSGDPKEPPAIDPRYMSHPIDLEVFARHMRYLGTIATSEPFASLLKEGGQRRRHEQSSKMDDLEAAKEYVRARAISMWHYAGTCAMMSRERGGVVDSNLIVHGTSNLRVVDASIMPLIPIANIQSTVYAVAEKACDLIKAEHGLLVADQ